MARLPVMTSATSYRAAIAALSIGALLALSCGSIEGADPYSLWRTYDDPGGAYHFHFPSPPWERGESSAFGLPVYVLDPDIDPAAVGPGAQLRLEAHMYWDANLVDIVAEANDGWHELGYTTGPPRGFLSAGGDQGRHLEAWNDQFWVRQVFYEDQGTVVTLFVWGSGDPDDPDLELLLHGFEPRPAEGG